MKNLFLSALMIGLVSLLTGCSFGGGTGSEQTPGADSTNTDNNNNTGEETPVEQPKCADVGKSYTGFAGTVLEAGRVDEVSGIDRSRVKPYSALQTEYPRVLGNTPANLAGSATTFETAPVRWYVEPSASAIGLYTAYRIAFQGCLTATATPAQYATAPTAGAAQTECANWAKKFWSRMPEQAEVDACVKVATADTASETDPKRRWAYTCASVLTAAGFMTY
jgi:hypothetical protein